MTSTSDTPVIAARGLAKSYGKLRALDAGRGYEDVGIRLVRMD